MQRGLASTTDSPLIPLIWTVAFGPERRPHGRVVRTSSYGLTTRTVKMFPSLYVGSRAQTYYSATRKQVEKAKESLGFDTYSRQFDLQKCY
jgi:hypothetical protein